MGDAGESLVERAEIRAGTGVQVGAKTARLAVRRTRIAATEFGAEAQSGRLDLDSVLVDMRQGGTGLNVVNWNTYDGPLGIVGRHVTVVGDGAPASTGVRVLANTPTEMASTKLEHSIVTGFGRPIVRQASAGSAILTLHYSATPGARARCRRARPRSTSAASRASPTPTATARRSATRARSSSRPRPRPPPPRLRR